MSVGQNHFIEPAFQNHSRNHAYQNHLTEPAFQNHDYQNHRGEAACNYHLAGLAYQHHPPGPADQNPTRDPSYQHHHPAQLWFSQDVAGNVQAEPPPAALPPGVNSLRYRRLHLYGSDGLVGPQLHQSFSFFKKSGFVWGTFQDLFSTFRLSDVDLTPTKKNKRSRPAKCNETQQTADQQQRTEVEASKKAKRVLNRFDGMSVEEVMARTLPDVIAPNLDILIVWHCFETFLFER